MCFSVNLNLVKEEIESRYGATLIDPDKYRPSYYYHAFAIPELPVICSGDRKNINIFTWGLIPSGTGSMSDAENIRSKTFNTRSEGFIESRSFFRPLINKRCIVPVKGFYEWQHVAGKKIPWYIHSSDDGIISLAGLYDKWIFDRTGEVFNTFTIITTEANDMLAEIHNSARRMPAILDDYAVELWLDPDSNERDIKNLLKPSKVEILKAHTIGPLVNNREADRNTPEVIKPYSYPVQTKLF